MSSRRSRYRHPPHQTFTVTAGYLTGKEIAARERGFECQKFVEFCRGQPVEVRRPV